MKRKTIFVCLSLCSAMFLIEPILAGLGGPSHSGSGGGGSGGSSGGASGSHSATPRFSGNVGSHVSTSTGTTTFGGATTINRSPSFSHFPQGNVGQGFSHGTGTFSSGIHGTGSFGTGTGAGGSGTGSGGSGTGTSGAGTLGSGTVHLHKGPLQFPANKGPIFKGPITHGVDGTGKLPGPTNKNLQFMGGHHTVDAAHAHLDNLPISKHHSQWYHGQWHGHWGGGYGGGGPWGWGPYWGGPWGWNWGWGGPWWWGYGWGGPWGWGWGVPWGWGWCWGGFGNWSAVNWGLGVVYVNPYCGGCQPIDVGNGIYLNYCQPIEIASYVDPLSSAVVNYPTGTLFVSAEAIAFLQSGQNAFRLGDNLLALDLTNKALSLMPRDPAIHEFRALVLFALGRYPEAACVLHSLLAVSPGWNWTTMIGLYPNVDIYTAQLRALENYHNLNPLAADANFVLGYHYMTSGYLEPALRRFSDVVKVAPTDLVASQMIRRLTPSTVQVALPASPPPTPEEISTPTTDPMVLSKVVGTWTATESPGSSFSLTMTPDLKFIWTSNKDGKTTSTSGNYVLSQTTLMLDDPNNGKMVTLITFGDRSFSLKMVGSPAGENELLFRRQ